MNKIINELFNRAGGRTEVCDVTGDEILTYNEHLDPVKFAELIVRDTLDQVAEFSRLTKAYQTQGIDPEIDVTREVLKNYGFTRFPRS